ncbi:MAG: DUF4126 family protein [Candidatus Acidiferrales bacterium]
MTILFVFLIGVLTGLRSLTPTAATSWAARGGWLKLRSPLLWIGTTPAAIVLTLLALAELVADKLPSTPSRTSPPGLIARVVLGGLSGACIAMGGEMGILVGALIGIVGALVGTFAGYQFRTRLVKALHTPDFVVAIMEDLICIGGSLWVGSRF